MPEVMFRDGPVLVPRLVHGPVHGLSAAVCTPFGLEVAVGVDDRVNGFARSAVRDHSVYDVGAIDAVRKESKDFGNGNVRFLRKWDVVRRRGVTKGGLCWVCFALHFRHVERCNGRKKWERIGAFL